MVLLLLFYTIFTELIDFDRDHHFLMSEANIKTSFQKKASNLEICE